VDLVALVETAAGLIANGGWRDRRCGVLRLVFGVGDFCRDTAMAPDAVGLAYPRAQLVIASRAAGIAAPIDSPTLDDHDLEDDTARSPASGMTGMRCIRSDQVGLVNSGFISSAGEDQWAQAVIARLGEDGAGVRVRSDRPLLHRALRIRLQVQQYARGA